MSKELPFYDFPYQDESPEDGEFLLELHPEFDATIAAEKIGQTINPYPAPFKANPIDISITFKTVLGLEKYIGDPKSRNVILNAVKEATESGNEFNYKLVIERLMLRRNEAKQRIIKVIK